MKRGALTFLFVCTLLPPFVGMGMFPVLALFAAQPGAHQRFSFAHRLNRLAAC